MYRIWILLIVALAGCGGVITEPGDPCQQVTEVASSNALTLGFCGRCTSQAEHRFTLATAGRPDGLYPVELHFELDWSQDWGAGELGVTLADGGQVIASSAVENGAPTFYVSGLTQSRKDISVTATCPVAGAVIFSGVLDVAGVPLS